MTRSSNGSRVNFDLEIERTLLVARRSHKIKGKIAILFGQMDNLHDRTLKELAAPDVAYQPLCIDYPELDV